LRAQSIIEQLDDEEMAVVSQAGSIVEKAWSP
jgi:hypothetical protein